MLFIPERKLKVTLKRLQERHVANAKRRSMERRRAYLKAKENGELDEYFANLNK